MSTQIQSDAVDYSPVTVSRELDLNKSYINVHDALHALLHQCLVRNAEYAKLDADVTNLEDIVERCRGTENPFDFAPCVHSDTKRRLQDARVRRRALLEQVYDTEVLPESVKVANDSVVRDAMLAYATILQRDPRRDELCDPFITLCHAALDRFQDISLPSLPLDSRAGLDIRFLQNPDHCLASVPVRVTPEELGKAITIQPKPDIICTSRKAIDANTDAPNSNNWTWHHVLQCIEVKRTSSDGAQPPSCADEQDEEDEDEEPQPDFDPGVKHTINLLVEGKCDRWIHGAGTHSRTDHTMSIMFVNRQGVFITPHFDFCADLPCFLSILFLLQRFTVKDWGIIPTLNPAAVAALNGEPTLPETITFDFRNDTKDPYPNNPDVPVIITPSYLNDKPWALTGRATGVYPASLDSPNGEKVVCKIYNPEVARHHEGKVLSALGAIADNMDPGMKKHLPTLKAYVDIADTDTRWLESLIFGDIRGHRVMRVVVLKELWPMERTLEEHENDKGETVGDEEGRTFIAAWLDVVKCHAFLWCNLVEHGDPSLANMMFDPVLKCGVLTDFDLSVFRWCPRVPGMDRTGTVPFMALRLLYHEYWDGKMVRYYHDELEALCWVLPYVWLGGIQPEGSYVKTWTPDDYEQCFNRKAGFVVAMHLEKRRNPTRRKPGPGNIAFVCRVVSKVMAQAMLHVDAWQTNDYEECCRQKLSFAMPADPINRGIIPDNSTGDLADLDAEEQRIRAHGATVLNLFFEALAADTSGVVPDGYEDTFPKPTNAGPTLEEIRVIEEIIQSTLLHSP